MVFLNFEGLNLYHFFKDEYGELYNGEGIGAVGLITPTQMINVVNIDGEDKVNGKINCWGGGAHQHTREKIIEAIYGMEYSEDIIYEKEDVRRGLTSRIIEIRYVNNNFGKMISINIPSFMNKSQYDNLCFLNDMIEEFRKSTNSDIVVNVSNNGFNPITCMVDSNPIFWDRGENNLLDAIRYYENHIMDINFEVFPSDEVVLNLNVKKYKF